MSTCIVCGAICAAPHPRVHWLDGQWLAVSDGPPTCEPACTALHSTGQIFDEDHGPPVFAPMPDHQEQREYHDWLMNRRRCERLGIPVPPIPKTATDRLVESQLAIAKLKWGYTP